MYQILLAEDNPGDVLLVQQALEDYNVQYQLHIVHDGAAAIEFIGHMGKAGSVPCPDLMLLDLNLPKVKGPEILREFRNHPECAETPVIVVTSSDAEKDRAQTALLGISEYFRKPSDFDAFMQLGALVRKVMLD